MNATQEVREQYKQVARQYIKHLDVLPRPPRYVIEFHSGQVSGLSIALSCLGVTSDEVREMYNTCEEEVMDEKANEDIGPGDVSYDEEGFVIKVNPKRLQPEIEQQAEQAFTEQEELDVIERPVSQAKVEKESEEDIYECEHCNAEFKKSEILYREYGGEIGGIAFYPRCKQETKLICVSDIVEARK